MIIFSLYYLSYLHVVSTLTNYLFLYPLNYPQGERWYMVGTSLVVHSGQCKQDTGRNSLGPLDHLWPQLLHKVNWYCIMKVLYVCGTLAFNYS